MVNTKIKGGVGSLKPDRKEKLKYSGYHITLNTNQKYEESDPHLKDDAEFLNNVVHDKILNRLQDYVKLGDDDEWKDSRVKDVQIQYAVEFGSRKQLHAHILIQIKHTNSKLHLDYEKIKKTVAKELGLDTVYFNSHLIRGSKIVNIEEYIQKTF